MERTVEVTFQLPATEVCIDIDVKTGVSLAKLAQLAVMFKFQETGYMEDAQRQ